MFCTSSLSWIIRTVGKWEPVFFWQSCATGDRFIVVGFITCQYVSGYVLMIQIPIYAKIYFILYIPFGFSFFTFTDNDKMIQRTIWNSLENHMLHQFVRPCTVALAWSLHKRRPYNTAIIWTGLTHTRLLNKRHISRCLRYIHVQSTITMGPFG